MYKSFTKATGCAAYICCHELQCAAGKWRMQVTQKDTSAEVEEGIRNKTVAKEIRVCFVCINVCSQVHKTLMKTAQYRMMAAGAVAKSATRTGVLTATAAEAKAARVISAAEVTIMSWERGSMGRETEMIAATTSMRAMASMMNSCAGFGHGSSDNSGVINSDENGGGRCDRVKGSNV